ncbi:CoA-dependent acyltransferase [Backusella circina FSU 941]|nr:CoA-dependent acyltransferase [Backusella circina FSU 941]
MMHCPPIISQLKLQPNWIVYNSNKPVGSLAREKNERLIFKEIALCAKSVNTKYLSSVRPLIDDISRTTPVKRAASITTAALEFKKLVTERNIEPDYVGDQPLCMDMYNYLFNSSRVASTPIDTAIEYNPFLNTHIVVIRKNRFYFIDTVHNGHQLNTKLLSIK